MKRLFVILLFIPSLSFAAITEWYVNNSGSGSGTGTSEANAMSFATFTDYMSTGGSFTAAPGARFNVKGAITGRTSTSDAWVNGGTVTSPVVVRGYNSTIGDLTSLARTDGNGPLVTTNYPTISYTTGRINVTGNFIIVEALSVTSANVTSSSGTITMTGTDIALKRCVVINSSTNANTETVHMAGARAMVIDCDISLTGASGALAAINCAVTTARIIGNRITGGPGIGITTSQANPLIAFNTIYATTGNGIALTGVLSAPSILYNTIVRGGADGINVITGNTFSQLFIGNMITDNTGDGIDMVSTSNSAFTANNRFRDNATTYNNAGDWITATSYNDVTSGAGASDYVNAAGNNYNLIWTSPGRGAGNPLYADIGALQAPTPTPTATATATATSTATATATATSTSTPTATATATPSFTPCAPTPGPTATSTPTVTPTATASATTTSTPTPTPPIETSYNFQG